MPTGQPASFEDYLDDITSMSDTINLFAAVDRYREDLWEAWRDHRMPNRTAIIREASVELRKAVAALTARLAGEDMEDVDFTHWPV